MICSAAHEPAFREVYRLTADLRTAIDVRDARYLVEASEASGIMRVMGPALLRVHKCYKRPK